MIQKRSISQNDKAFFKTWPQHIRLSLIIGEWRSLFSAKEMMAIIALALNHCTHYEGLKIIAYLITEEKLYLIAKGDRKWIDTILPVFYQQIDSVVRGQLELSQHIDSRLKDWENAYPKENLKTLFTEFPFKDLYLIKLISGQNIESNYYDAHFEKIKDQVRAYNYCSAIDYSGAKGPVLVTTNWMESTNEHVKNNIRYEL